MQMQAHIPTVSARFKSQAPNWTDLLKRCDDPCWEAPHGFEHGSTAQAFRSFVTALEECLGRKVDHESSASQDDSRFHAEIFLASGALRFSNFGKLVAFVGDSRLPAQLAQQVSDLADELGYTLVPQEALDGRYAGRHARLGSCTTWQHRFFE